MPLEAELPLAGWVQTPSPGLLCRKALSFLITAKDSSYKSPRLTANQQDEGRCASVSPPAK